MGEKGIEERLCLPGRFHLAWQSALRYAVVVLHDRRGERERFLAFIADGEWAVRDCADDFAFDERFGGEQDAASSALNEVILHASSDACCTLS